MRHRWLALLPAVVVCFAATSCADEPNLRTGAAALSTPGTSTEAEDLSLGVEAIEGVVGRVDAKTGVLVLRTEAGLLTVHVPAGWAAKVKPGDRLKLAMALDPAPPPAQASADRDKKGLRWLLLLLIQGRGTR